MKGTFVRIKKMCEKISSVNLRFEIFVTVFRVQKLFGTFEKRAPGLAILTFSCQSITRGKHLTNNMRVFYDYGLCLIRRNDSDERPFRLPNHQSMLTTVLCEPHSSDDHTRQTKESLRLPLLA